MTKKQEKCTKSKKYQKTITRHIWEEYKEQMNENRYTKVWKENYPLRKETIERTFWDCKEQMGLRFTRVRGLLKNEQNATMIFACHNLKKMANWKWKDRQEIGQNHSILSKIWYFLNSLNKKDIFFLNIPLCQQSEVSCDTFFHVIENH